MAVAAGDVHDADVLQILHQPRPQGSELGHAALTAAQARPAAPRVHLPTAQVTSLFIEGLQPSQPHRVTSGLFTKSNLTQVEYNTKHAHFKNVKHINI